MYNDKNRTLIAIHRNFHFSCFFLFFLENQDLKKKSNVYNFAIFFNLENCFRDLNLYDCENTTKATTNSGGSSSTSGRGRSQTFYCSSGCFEEFDSNKNKCNVNYVV